MEELLLIAVFLSLLISFCPIIIKTVSNQFYRHHINNEAKDEVISIRKQMNSLSRVDELARYIKLERKLNKLIDEQKNEAQTKLNSRRNLQNLLAITFQVVLKLISIILFWTHRGYAVIILPTHWTYPINGILSWPTNVPGGVSFPVWFLITNTVTKTLAKPFL